MNMPLIDVIIAVHNGEQYIAQAVASVQAQTWKNIRIIIADDGSSDSTPALVAALRETDSRITVMTRPHEGVSATLNAAIRASTASYLSFLDSDDVWHEEKLEKQMQALEKNEAKICFCLVKEFEHFNPQTHRTHRARSESLKGFSKITFLGQRAIFNSFGLFDEQIAVGEFVEWYSRLVRADEPAIMLEEVLTFRRVHHHNTTRTIRKNTFLKLLKTHLDEKRK